MKVTWFDGWHPALDEALLELPEKDNCPYELYRLLVQNPGFARKRTVLVTERGVPVAVAGLRQRGQYYSWEPVTQYIIPGVVFPVQPGYLIRVLEALGVDVWVAWWRMENPPPSSRWMRFMKSSAVYRVRCSDDFEHYWRQSGHWNTVQKCRKRCRDFTFAINTPGAAEWVIRNWGKTWEIDPANVSDRLVAAKYLENQGRHYSFLLLDQDKPVVGHSFISHCNDFVWQITYRDPAYDWYGVGTRLMDLVFHWTAEVGFATLDLGGEHDYKIRWAPQDGQKLEFNICPEYLFQAKQVVNWARIVGRKVVNWIHSGQAQAG